MPTKKIHGVLAALVFLPVVVVVGSRQWWWREAFVDVRAEHLELLYGSPDADPVSWTAVARIGPPRGRVFPVQWLLDPDAVESRDAVEAVANDLDFYLKDVGRPDPWSYAEYHCGTASNGYGDVHWVCFVRRRPADDER